jgi:hypothetical protein
VRRGRVNALKQVALLDDLHAFEREVDYLWMRIRRGLCILSKKECRNQQKRPREKYRFSRLPPPASLLPLTVLPAARRY